MRFCRTAIVGSLVALAALAQAPGAGMAGSVVDRWETGVAGASLTLTDTASGAKLTATANETGGYTFPKLASGRYDLSVHADGFKPYSRHAIEIDAETAAPMDVRLTAANADPEGDLKKLETLVAAKPDDYVAHFHLGLAYLVKRDYQKSQNELAATLRLNADYWPARLAMDQLLLRAAPISYAQSFAQQTAASRPGSWMATAIAAEAAKRVGETAAAAELIDGFLKSHPNDSDALLESGTFHLNRNQYPEAEQSFAKAYSLDPSAVAGLQGQAAILLLKNAPEKAVDLVAAEVKKNPERSDLRTELATTEFRANQVDKAIGDYQSLLEKYRDDPKGQAALYARLAEAYRAKEDLPRSIENLKKATQLAPDNSAYFNALASADDRSGKLQDAISNYKQALLIEPGNALLMNNAAFTLVKASGNTDEALRLVQLARRQLPDSTEILDTLGWVYLKKEMVDSACQVFEDLIQKEPANPTFHYHYGAALAQKGDKAAALKELNAALESHPGKDDEAAIRELIKKLS